MCNQPEPEERRGGRTAGRQRTLMAAVTIRDDDRRRPGGDSHKCQALSIRRPPDGADDAVDEPLRRATEERHAPQRPLLGQLGRLPSHEVDEAPVRRHGHGQKRDTWLRRHDLNVAPAFCLPHPQARGVAVTLDVRHELAVGRDRRPLRVVARRQLHDLQILKGDRCVSERRRGTTRRGEIGRAGDHRHQHRRNGREQAAVPLPGGRRSCDRGSHRMRLEIALQPQEIRAEIRCRLVAELPTLVERLLNDLLETRGKIRANGTRRHRFVVQDRRRDDRARGPSERRPARRHLVEDQAEREEIRARVERLAAQLLRRHVCHGAHGDAVAGQQGVGRSRRPERPDTGCRSGGLGQTKIENLGSAAGQKDVGRLDVAMQDPATVRRVEGIGDAQANLDHLGHVERAARQPLLQRLAVQQFHREKRRVRANVVNRADVGMVQRRCRARLALESLQRRLALGTIPQHLDRDEPIQPAVARLVHFSHAARTERGQDFVRTEARTGRNHRSPLKSTMSLVTVARATARRVPSRDQAKAATLRSVKCVSWRGAPPSSGCTQMFRCVAPSM